MTVSLWLGTTGRLDKVPTEDVAAVRARVPRLPAPLSTTRSWPASATRLKFEDDTESSLTEAYDSFLDQFETSEGGSIHVGDQVKEEALEDDELEQEQIVKQKRG